MSQPMSMKTTWRRRWWRRRGWLGLREVGRLEVRSKDAKESCSRARQRRTDRAHHGQTDKRLREAERGVRRRQRSYAPGMAAIPQPMAESLTRPEKAIMEHGSKTMYITRSVRDSDATWAGDALDEHGPLKRRPTRSSPFDHRCQSSPTMKLRAACSRLHRCCHQRRRFHLRPPPH